MKLSEFLHDLTTATAIFDLDYDCFSLGQLESKEWLVQILNDVRLYKKIDLGTIYILCGWYGILAAMLFLNFYKIEKIRSFDLDPSCEKIADQINKKYSSDNWKFKAVTQNIFDINFDKHTWQCWSNKNNRMSYPIEDIPNTIINTSCEHTDSTWFEKVPDDKFVILQSNDFIAGRDHINCMIDLDEFKRTYPMKEVYYSGSMATEKYNRFMLIGRK